MKNKYVWLIGALSLGMFAACSGDNDGIVPETPENGNEVRAQLAISVASTANTRTTTPGDTGEEIAASDNENKISSLTIVLTDVNDIARQIIQPALKTEKTAKKDVRATVPFTVNAGQYKVYVLANYAQSALSPIIKNSTDMKAVFDIVNRTDLTGSSNNAFLMANTTAPALVTLNAANATTPEVDDDGNNEASGINLNLVQVVIERVVSKVTFNNADNQAFIVEDGTGTVANAVLKGVGLINLNKKMTIVKDATMATNKPSAVGTWYYPHDANYSTVLNGAASEAAWLAANFDEPSVNTFNNTPNTAAFYCPENTMTALAQQNGQTTGVVYQVEYTPAATAFTALAKDASDTYSQRFTAVLALSGKDAEIVEEIFTTAGSDKTFYTYNDLIFRTKKAAILYKVIVENADAATINTQFTALKGTSPADVYKYTDGYTYYPVWIKHNPEGTHMQQDKYGVVRNHWYELKVNSVKKLGYHKPTYADPKDPDDKETAPIQVKATINKWVLVLQENDLE